MPLYFILIESCIPQTKMNYKKLCTTYENVSIPIVGKLMWLFIFIFRSCIHLIAGFKFVLQNTFTSILQKYLIKIKPKRKKMYFMKGKL